MHKERILIKKREPDLEGLPEFSAPQRFDYDDEKLRNLIINARLKSAYESNVKSGIEDLLREIKN